MSKAIMISPHVLHEARKTQHQKTISTINTKYREQQKAARKVIRILHFHKWYQLFVGFFCILMMFSLAGYFGIYGWNVLAGDTFGKVRIPLGFERVERLMYISKLPEWQIEYMVQTKKYLMSPIPVYFTTENYSTDYLVDVENTSAFSANSGGLFEWSSKPEDIRPFTFEELNPADQAFCEWSQNTGVQYLSYDRETTLWARLDIETCLLAITTETWGGVPAGLSMAVKRTESGDSAQNTQALSVASAKGLLQFLEGSFNRNKPWPEADINGKLDPFLAASNMLRKIKVEEAFFIGKAEFVKEFACEPWYEGCQCWNLHAGHAESVYELGWKLQEIRMNFWEQYEMED